LEASQSLVSIGTHHRQLLNDAYRLADAALKMLSFHDDTLATIETLRTITAELRTV